VPAHVCECATGIALAKPRPAWREGWNDCCTEGWRNELPMKIKSKVKAGTGGGTGNVNVST
jgi:hypothetical protein